MSVETVVVRDTGLVTVVVTDNRLTVSEVDSVLVVGSDSAGPQGPQGSTGPTGPQGPAGVYVSDTPPANTDLIWVDTTGL